MAEEPKKRYVVLAPAEVHGLPPWTPRWIRRLIERALQKQTPHF